MKYHISNIIIFIHMQVTNVRIGSDAREVKRRKDEVSAREKRRKRLEDQANESAEKFSEVNSRWKFILESNDPLDLYHDIEEQRGKSGSLLCSLLRLLVYGLLHLCLMQHYLTEYST